MTVLEQTQGSVKFDRSMDSKQGLRLACGIGSAETIDESWTWTIYVSSAGIAVAATAGQPHHVQRVQVSTEQRLKGASGSILQLH